MAPGCWQEQRRNLIICSINSRHSSSGLRNVALLPILYTESNLKAGIRMKNSIEFESTYQGITFDERMALRNLFINEDDTYAMAERLPGRSVPEGPLQ